MSRRRVIYLSGTRADFGLMESTLKQVAATPGLDLQVAVEPQGEWPETIPRLGLRLALPGTLTSVDWIGLGPGEAYADSDEGVRYGRWQADVEQLSTPYVRPQENGQRMNVRRVRLSDLAGRGLEITGEPSFGLTARPWSTAALDAARHTADLVPDGLTWVHLDHAQHGLGSHSCGPDVAERHRLRSEPARFGFTFRRI